jgi:cation diffusion facilitator CzcD-associated flavoprotein CzcO
MNRLIRALGAGQAGLAVAARLKMLCVKSLIVDRESRTGDNWRARYRQLFLHGPVWLNHMPYLPFPESWPVFTPKDKFADWLECYAKTLELNIWTRTVIKSSSWNDETSRWTIEVFWEDLLESQRVTTQFLYPKVSRHSRIEQLLT